jgi:hypothetical protein
VEIGETRRGANSGTWPIKRVPLDPEPAAGSNSMSGIQGYYRRKRRRLPTLEDDVAAKEVGVAADDADEGDDVSDAVQGLLQQRKQSPRKAGGLGTEAVFSVLISGPAALFEVMANCKMMHRR